MCYFLVELINMIYFTFSNSKKNKYLGHEIHAVSERCDEPNGGVPVEGGQLLLPHQPVDVPINTFFYSCTTGTCNRQSTKVKKKPLNDKVTKTTKVKKRQK